ncbi:MAG: hypothetical protein HGB04_08455 [Chlorobiaceae bacterium]|nr:hypothetical protein [Chlorobiaceae bacterium]
MTELHTRIRRLSAALLLASALCMAIPSGAVLGASGGMLSASAASSEVRESLAASSEPATADRQVELENGNRLAPWKVAAISAVLPGYGQVYNHAAWKLPIYYGLMTWFAKNAIDDNGKYLDYRSQYLADHSSAAAASRDDYRKKRNTQIVWLCIAYVAGIVDAYVDTQLYDFDRIIDEKVGASGAPADPAPLVSVSMKF